MTKYLYIDKYINYYKGSTLIYTDRVSREIVPDVETGRRILANKNPQKIENKKYISVYEEYKLLYNDGSNYKCYYNSTSPDGMMRNV